MIKAVLHVPVVLSLVVLGAHFMRYGDTILVAGTVVLIALLFVRQPWVARLMQVVLVLGALEWLRTLYGLAQMRAALGEPYGRMLIILGGVAAVTACSALVFQSQALKDIYGLDERE
jgi:hypothetical protein